MPRPFQVMQNPVFHPHVCVQCGVGAGRREWFVDLGFTVDQYMDVDNTAVYLCNECFNNMTIDVGLLVLRFRQEHQRWDGGENPSYTWMESHDTGGKSSGTGEGQGESEPTSSSSDRDDQNPESNDPESESTDSGNAVSTDDSDPDGSTEGFSATFGRS